MRRFYVPDNSLVFEFIVCAVDEPFGLISSMPFELHGNRAAAIKPCINISTSILSVALNR